MSGPKEEKIVATGISGTNNFVQVARDINSMGEQITQIILPSTSLQENSIWFDVRKPVESFTGRKRELENLHKKAQRKKRKNEHKLTVISQENSIWFDVRKPVESFTGRIRELEDLHKLVKRNLGENNDKLTVISQVTSISGLGGIGKSEIARMYAREHGQDYDVNVIWVNAATYGTLKESFHRLAKDKLNILTKFMDGQEKDIKSIVQEVYKYFSKRKSLFFFDNA